MDTSLQWVMEDAGELTRVLLKGVVTEEADLGRLTGQLHGRPRVRFDLGAVRSINSCGVREWINFVRSFPAGCRLELERCAPCMVSQLNSVRNFAGAAAILSVGVPFLCTGCDAEETLVFDLAQCAEPHLEGHRCGRCGAALEFDDMPDHYFSFLRTAQGGA